MKKYMQKVVVTISSILYAVVVRAEYYSPAKAFEAAQAKNAVVLDVRSIEETKSGIAKDAKVLPITEIESNSALLDAFLKATPKTKEIYVYCAKGGRAGRAKEILEKKGYRVENIGGFSDWQKAGLPTQMPK